MRSTRYTVEVRTNVSMHKDRSLETRSKVRALRYDRALRREGFHPISRAVPQGNAGASVVLVGESCKGDQRYSANEAIMRLQRTNGTMLQRASRFLRAN